MPKIEKPFAKSLIDAARSLDSHLNKLHELGEELPNELRKEFRSHLGHVAGDVYTGIIIPLVREYPDLDLDK
jgi:hypothetical protein